MGIFFIHVVAVVTRAFFAHQVDTIIKRSLRFGHSSRTPTVTDIDSFQTDAGMEHRIHGFHIGGVEGAQVKARQFLAVGEQAWHACHLVCVEVTQVKYRHTRATGEHARHVGHIDSVEI